MPELSGMSEMSLENKRYWELPEGAGWHGPLSGVDPGEEAILTLADAALRGDVLEIGVGGGRISGYLARVARTYTGIDYSPVMIAISREKFPGLDFRLGDARDLSPFGDGSFDAVCIFGAAIDDVSPEERVRVLAEVRRVLRGGGTFVFSSHNLDANLRSAWSWHWLRHRRPWGWLRGIANRLRNRLREVHGDGWAIINDGHAAYSVLTYYVRKERQMRMLAESGFDTLAMFGVDEGRRLATGDTCRDYAIYYAARRR